MKATFDFTWWFSQVQLNPQIHHSKSSFKSSYVRSPWWLVCTSGLSGVLNFSYPSRWGRVPAESAPSSPCHASLSAHPHLLQYQLLQPTSNKSSRADWASHWPVPHPSPLCSHLLAITQWESLICGSAWYFSSVAPSPPLLPDFSQFQCKKIF